MEKTYRILKLLILVLLFAVLMVGAYVLYNNLSAEALPQQTLAAQAATDPTQNATAAPDFTVYAQDGTAYKLSDFRGKPVILNFWASWCGPCKMEMPDFQQAYEEYGDEIVFLMVNLTDGYQETQQTASDFIASTDYTFPVYYDLSFEAASNYAVSAVPVTYFISAEGEAIAKGQGMLSLESIQKGIDLILPQE